MPDAFIGVDVIVGMRGETDAMFRDAKSFMESMDVCQYHVFSYSERPGTKALEIPYRVSPEEKHERSRQVLEISDRKLHTFYNTHARETRPVLLEHGSAGGVLHGFTDNYIRVEVDKPAQGLLEDNTVRDVRLGEWNAEGDALKGIVVDRG